VSDETQVPGSPPPPASPGGSAAGGAPAAGRALPPASLSFLIASLAAQAQVALGRFENPVTKRTELDLPTARHAVDLLEVLEKKTKGNLEPQEIALISHVLWDLRLAYVQSSNASEKGQTPK
jgi:hypothetical protein